MTRFLAHLRCWKDDDSDPNIDEHVEVEVTTFDKDGLEIRFKDRDEDIYLTFEFSDLARALQNLNEP